MSHRTAGRAGEVQGLLLFPDTAITSRAGWASANKRCHLKGGPGILVTGPLPDAGATSPCQEAPRRCNLDSERPPASLPIRAQPFKSLPRSSAHAGLLTLACWEMSLRAVLSRHLAASAPRASFSQSLCGTSLLSSILVPTHWYQ